MAGQNKARGETQTETYRRSRQSQLRHHVVVKGEEHAKTLWVGHSFVAVHRSIEMSQFKMQKLI